MTLALEDMANSINGSDYDYNDHFWGVSVSPVSSTPIVSIAGGADTAEGSLTDGTFLFTRTGDTSASLTVSTMAWTGGTGAATAGADYTSAVTATFAAGSSTATLLIHAVDDSLVEGTEMIGLYVTGGTGYQVDMMAYAASIALLDNDAAGGGGTPTVSIAAGAGTAEGGSTDGTFLLTRTGDTSSSLTVNYGTLTAMGMANPYGDFVSVGSTFGSVTFAAGSATATVVVHAIDDALVEGPETIGLVLSAGTNYQVNMMGYAASIALADNDSITSLSTVSIAAGANIIQGDSNLGWFVIHRTSGVGSLTVNYSAPTGGAKVGTEQSGLSTSAGSVTFLPGQTDIALLFQVDGVEEGTSIGVQIFGSQTGAYVLNLAAAAVVINLDLGAEPNAVPASRSDMSAEWNRLLSFTPNAGDVVSVTSDIEWIRTSPSQQFTRKELLVLLGISEGRYDNKIGQISQTVALKAEAIQSILAARGGVLGIQSAWVPRFRDHRGTDDHSHCIGRRSGIAGVCSA